MLSWLKRRQQSLARHFSGNQRTVRAAQRRALRSEFGDPSGVRRLIVFLSPGRDQANGGIMSIVSIFTETRRLGMGEGTACVICSVPIDPPLLRYTKFENSVTLFDFIDVLEYFSNASELLIHIPEYAVRLFVASPAGKALSRLKRPTLGFNVLLQNVKSKLFRFEDVELLHKLGTVTCTTAHKAYSGPDTARKMGCPVHLLSVWVSPEKYERVDYGNKQDLLVISPDPHPRRDAIIEQIHRELPSLATRVVWNITYAEYRDLIRRAKWSLTFGEGLDGYFVETIFSGGIGFAVYNEEFFTEDFRGLRTVYPSYDDLTEKIIADIRDLDSDGNYRQYQGRQFDICESHYRYENYLENLSAYYRKFWPASFENCVV